MTTATELRNKAAAQDKEAAASFERCDTDGFLSQWASGISAELNRAKAAIIEDGGVAEFIGLYEGDRRVKAKQGYKKFNGYTSYYWLVHEDETELREARGKPFFPQGERSRVLKQHGLTERREMAPAAAKIHGTGTGLAGCATCRVINFRTGDQWGLDATLVTD